MNKTVIFVLYHKEAPIFSSEVYHPLQTGCSTATSDLGILRDDSGDSISVKNPHYGELTAWYWVWKNWLPAHPETDRIGFCHYRRFLDPFHPPVPGQPFRPVSGKHFSSRFHSWNDDEVDTAYHWADIVVPKPLDLRQSPLYDRRNETVYTQYCKAHPFSDMDLLLEQVSEESPESAKTVKSFFNGHVLRDCLMFVMRRDLFVDLAEWTFRHLFELETKCHWERYTGYMDIRTPAYLMERFFNVWLELHGHVPIIERDSIRIADQSDGWRRRLRRVLRRLRNPPRDAREIPLPEFLLP